MNDHSRMLLAIGATAGGPALAAAGSYLLGTARAVARHGGADGRRRADVAQYAAALAALAGFLLLAGGVGLLVAEITPGGASMRLITGAVAGVLVFTFTGVAFSRLADAAEGARVRKIPPPVYPTGPQLPPPAPPSAPTTSAPYHVNAETATDADAAEAGTDTHADGDPDAAPARVEAEGDLPVGETRSDQEPEQHHEPRGSDRHGEPADEPDQAHTGEPAPDESESIVTAADLVRSVRPGWIYRDDADQWFLGVGAGAERGAPLLHLPAFTAAAAHDPAYPLVVVGAGEIAVVPVARDLPDGGDDAT